jgi:hypothetical protein
MNVKSSDPLIRRLQSLPVATPRTLVPAVLASAARDRRRTPWGSIRIIAGAVVLLLAAATAASYFAPRFGTALADAPILGAVTQPLLRDAGLVNVSGNVTALSSTSASDGIQVQLVGGYADGIRTVLLLKVTPAGRDVVTQAAELTDQFGQQYAQMGSYADASTGLTALEFAPVTGPASELGARLTLRVSQLTSLAGADINGDWRLSGTISLDETRAFPLPSRATLGASTIVFTSGVASPNSIEVRFAIDGLSPAQIASTEAGVTVSIVSPAGTSVAPLDQGSAHGAASLVWLVIWPKSIAGIYHIDITIPTLGTVVRSIRVP